MGPPSFWVWASLLALHSEREKVNAGNLVIPYYLKMEVMALGLVQTVHGELNFLFPCILLGSSGFRKEVAGRRPTVLARAPCIRVQRPGCLGSPSIHSGRARAIARLEEISAGVCTRDSANVDIKGIRKFSVVVPAAYPHLFLYLSQGHSLIPGHSPELGRRALPCDGGPGGPSGRQGRGGGRAAPPGWPGRHLPGGRLKAGSGGRQGGVPGAEEGPRGAGGGIRGGRGRCAAAKAGGAAAPVRHAGGGHGGLRPTRRLGAGRPGRGGGGRTRPGSRERRGPGPAGGRQRAAGSIHSRGSASFPGLRWLRRRVRGECAVRPGQGPRAEAEAAAPDPAPRRLRPRAPAGGDAGRRLRAALWTRPRRRPTPASRAPGARPAAGGRPRPPRGVWRVPRCAGLRVSATILCEGMPPSSLAGLGSASAPRLLRAEPPPLPLRPTWSLAALARCPGSVESGPGEAARRGV